MEEKEIKIEYFEFVEFDPLCEDIAENAESKPHHHDNNFAANCNNKEMDADRNFEHVSNDQPLSLCDLVDNGNTNTKAEWYKDIDSTGRYTCKYCNLNYSTVQTVRNHVKMKHPEKALLLKDLVLKNKRNSKIKCHICKLRFKSIVELQEHSNNHNMENLQLSCKICNASFKIETEMHEHLLLKHNLLKNKYFSCRLCGYRTLKKSHYNQHQNTHNTIKNYKCHCCEYSTNYLPNLKIHERNHTNEKPYTCDFEGCNYCCSAKSALNSHKLKHKDGNRILFCEKCSYQTIYKQSLEKHLGSHMRKSRNSTS